MESDARAFEELGSPEYLFLELCMPLQEGFTRFANLEKIMKKGYRIQIPFNKIKWSIIRPTCVPDDFARHLQTRRACLAMWPNLPLKTAATAAAPTRGADQYSHRSPMFPERTAGARERMGFMDAPETEAKK